MSYDEKADIEFHQGEFERMVEAIAPGRKGNAPFARALDIGGGGGMHSAYLTRIANRVICTDFIDQNARYNGEFVKLLGEKFERNGVPFDAARLEFHAGDAMDMMYRDASFDLVVSFNAFEHIPDPRKAAAEVVRVLKPGGVAYLSFDPIWACDTGSHFFHRVPTPWEHLLVPPADYARRMQEAGAAADEVDDFMGAMNKVRLDTFRSIFRNTLPRTRNISYQEWRGVADPSHPSHPNYARARKLGYTDDDLMVRGICTVFTRTS